MAVLCALCGLLWSLPVHAVDHETYEAQSGDTLEGIAWRFGLTPQDLAIENGILQPDLLAPGQTLGLPPGAQPVFARGGGATALVHIMQRGETARSVALHYAIDLDQVLRHNDLADPASLTAGQPLTLLVYESRATGSGDVFLPPALRTLADDQFLYQLAFDQNLNLTALRLINALLPPYTIPGSRLLIPPAVLLRPISGQSVTESPTTTPSPTAAPTTTPTPSPAPTKRPTAATPQPTAAPTEPPPPTEALQPSPTPQPPPQQGLSVEFGDPIFYEDGRVEVIFITVHNLSVSPAVEGGLHYFQPNPDGGLQWVTLLGVDHQELPIAIVEDAPLWRAAVTLTDGSVWPFYAGCVYLEEVNHVGWEPTGPDTGFEWVVHWTGGFFDCGNAYHTKPEDFGPGQSATVPLTVYLQHPRQWEFESPPGRRVQSLSLGLYRSDGVWLGEVASATFP